MKLIALSLLAAALMVGTASADTFKVEGTGIDGAPYTGTVDLEQIKDLSGNGRAFDVTWKVGTDTVQGLGLVSGDNVNVLTIGYLFKGALGVLVMTQEGEKATGTWYIDGAPGTGHETWTKQ